MALGDPKKLPMLDFAGAAAQYVNGSYNTCILQSAFSVEIALLLKLDEKLNGEEKEKIRKQNGLFFGKAIDLAEQKGIVSKEDREKIEILNNLRNMFAHPGNWVTLVKQLSPSAVDEMLPDIVPEIFRLIEGIKDIAKPQLDNLTLAKEKAEKYLDSRLQKIPELAWAARQDTMNFQKKRIAHYWAEVIRDLFQRDTFIDFTKHLGILPEYAQKRYPFNEETALETLRMTSEILKHLGVLQFKRP